MVVQTGAATLCFSAYCSPEKQSSRKGRNQYKARERWIGRQTADASRRLDRRIAAGARTTVRYAALLSEASIDRLEAVYIERTGPTFTCVLNSRLFSYYAIRGCCPEDRIVAWRSLFPCQVGCLAARTHCQHRKMTNTVVFEPALPSPVNVYGLAVAIACVCPSAPGPSIKRCSFARLSGTYVPIRTISSSVHATLVSRPAAKSACIAGASTGGIRNSRRLMPHERSTDARK